MIIEITLGGGSPEEEGNVATKTRVMRPPQYKVILFNDDYTTMEFVILVLQNIFGKSFEEAQAIMLEVHEKGAGVCGIYTYEVAETKVSKVLGLARDQGHPLKCTMEKA